MPELVRILTDDHGRITHLVTDEEDRLSVEDLAAKLADGEDYYVTFGEDERYPITMVAEDGHLEPTIDDAEGTYSIWDLPQEEDPEEQEIPEMFDEIENMGEFDDPSAGSTGEQDFGASGQPGLDTIIVQETGSITEQEINTPRRGSVDDIEETEEDEEDTVESEE